MLSVVAVIIAGAFTACSDDESGDLQMQENVVRLTDVGIMPYTDRSGKVFAHEEDAKGWYGPMKVRFVAGDVIHAQLTFSNNETLYADATLRKDGKWAIDPNPEQAEGVKLVKTLFFYDEKEDRYADGSAFQKAWQKCFFFDGYTNPFNYPDCLLQRTLTSSSDGEVSFEGDLSVSVQLQHMNAMVVVDRIDNRTGKEIAAITAYNFWGESQPEDEGSQEIYPLLRAGDAETPWLSTVASSSNTLNQFKVILSDNHEIILPVEKPDWDTSELEGLAPERKGLYYVLLVIDNDPAACRATIR